jgi:3-oxoacyl-[acyl-carrier protein] reductase
VVDRAGSLDISINLIAVDHIQGRPLIDLSPSDFTLGLEARIRTHFVTARAAARHMVRQRSGAILMVTATSCTSSKATICATDSSSCVLA